MNVFSQALRSWQPFYTTIAAASATLVGLLFVALTVNRSRLDEKALLLAGRTFVSLLDTLLIALIFLVPHSDAASLGLALFVFGLARTLGVLIRAFLPRAKRKPNIRSQDWRHEAVVPLLSSLALVAIAFAIYERGERLMYLPVVVILFLIGTAARNAWALLLKE